VIIFATDAHQYDDSDLALLTRFYDYVRVKQPRLFILGGDWGDPWKAPWEQILATQSWAGLQSLAHVRADAGLQTVYLRGNHDHSIRQGYLPGATIVNRFIDGQYEFVHGWQRDVTWRWPLSLIAFWIADHLPGLMVPIHSRLFGPTPGAEKPNPQIVGRPIELADVLLYEVRAQDWNLHFGLIHTAWREHSNKHKRRVVIGHTHCLWPFDGMIADGGALYEDRSFLEIGNQVEVITI